MAKVKLEVTSLAGISDVARNSLMEQIMVTAEDFDRLGIKIEVNMKW